MNVLVIGNGGREHAVIQALAKSPKVDKIYAMKGNAGIAQIAELVNVDYCDVKAVGDWVDQKGDIDFTVVTPDDPLALGLVDELESRGHRAFGPNKNAAIIEASKAFSKALMKKYNIPTAKYETFSAYEEAAVNNKHYSRNNHLQNCYYKWVVNKKFRQWPIPHNVPHRQIHKGQK